MGTITLKIQDSAPLEEITREVDGIPMLTHVAMRLLGIIGSKDHSLKEVVNLVGSDAALTARILRVANSAAFYRGSAVTTVAKAVLNLGEKLVAGIAIGSCTSKVFKKPLEGYESPEGELWNHSLRAAIAAREVAVLTSDDAFTDLAFTAGLLHDIGKSVISEFLKGTATTMISMLEEGNVEDFLAAERNQIGVDHTEVGYSLASHWNLPEPIRAAIKHHHHPSDAEEDFRKLAYVVHLGDILAMMGGTGTGADALSYKIDAGYEEHVSISKDDINILLLHIQDEFSRTKTAVLPE
jgi:putative nucleotidyltransferase with HDIG domain